MTNTHFWSYLAHVFSEREIFQTKVVEKIKTHILCSVTFFRISCRLWDNVEEKQGRAGQTTIRRMRTAWQLTKATDTYSEYVILIAFPRQQCSRERAAMLRYRYTSCLMYCIYVCIYSLRTASQIAKRVQLFQSRTDYLSTLPFTCT
jgi:hypothetical protein